MLTKVRLKAMTTNENKLKPKPALWTDFKPRLLNIWMK